MQSPNQSRLHIAIEGIDGAGKSTLTESILKESSLKGLPLVRLNFCGGTDSRIRRLIKHIYTSEKSRFKQLVRRWASLEAILYFFCMKHNWSNLSIKENCIVVSDRSILTLFVRFPQYVWFFQMLSGKQYVPDTVFILDLPAEMCVTRIYSRDGTQFYHETNRTLAVAREKYLMLLNDKPKFLEHCDIIVLDASQSPDRLHQLIVKRMEKML